MREILHIQSSEQAWRNQIRAKFGEVIYDEHGIDAKVYCAGKSDLHQIEGINKHGSAGGGRFVPHAILMDLEHGAMDSICSSPFGQMFRAPNSFMFRRRQQRGQRSLMSREQSSSTPSSMSAIRRRRSRYRLPPGDNDNVVILTCSL